MRGRPPIPTAAKIARGTYRKDRDPGEASFPGDAPKCPPWLSREGKAEWKRQAANLSAAGLLRAADGACLAVYCEAFAEFVEAKRALKEGGYTTTTAAGKSVCSPWVAIKNAAAERMLRAAAQFGLTPASRARVGPGERPPAPSPKARFFDPSGGVATRDRG